MEDYEIIFFVDPPGSSSEAREHHTIRTGMTEEEIREYCRENKKGKIIDSIIKIEWTKNLEVTIIEKKKEV